MKRTTLSLGTLLAAGSLVAIAACDRPRQTTEETQREPVGVGETRGAPAERGQAAPAEPMTEPRQQQPGAMGQDKAARGEQAPAGEKAKAGAAAEGKPAEGQPAEGDEAKTGSAPTNLPPFEGELKMKVGGQSPETFEYAMKGDKIRLGISAAPGQANKGIDAIIDTDDRKAIVLLNDKKQFVEVDLAKLADQAAARVQQIDVEKTGKTRTVSGRECEEWKIKDKDYRVTACVVQAGPYFDLTALEEQAGFQAPAWVHRVVDAGYIPLQVSLSDAQGKQLASTQVTDTSRKVPESKFDVPKGYTKVDRSAIPGVPR